ncbi:acyl-protein thioesterase 1-like [Centruroides sculpturatus]|uniref:acyl-protein thioesterase 1-like n=1 Tax=Centruroides sculpturatus TaxID=218467 RepID=UPI000C6EF6EB|nr:acyl-protein thioesterase 1-like [Centruroides sculpturatus]
MGTSSSRTMPPPVILSNTAKQTATIIFLHGLGDTGHGWSSIFSPFRASHIKYVFPTAPTIPVTINAGFSMPAWFDLKSISLQGPEDEEGIRSATEKIHQMIEYEESKGIPSNRIIIGGFSQGGALALYSALRYKKTLAGIIAFSCWLPLHTNFPQDALGNMNTPMIQCHGDSDPIVPFEFGQLTSEYIKKFMSNTKFKIYPSMMHTFCEEELKDTINFINQYLPPVNESEDSESCQSTKK